MSLRTLLRTLALVTCLTSASSRVWAQSDPDVKDPASEEGKRAEGKARYQRGVAAYSAGRYKDAIDLFLQADALAPSAALSFNIARAYEKIGDDAATLQWFRDFRRRAPDAKNGAEVDARIHELEGLLAAKGVQQLTVLSRPLGATVIVDEQPVGVTPYTGQLPPGTHRVALSLKGYADSDRQLELPADHALDLDVPLVPATQRPGLPPAVTPAGPTGNVTASSPATSPAPADRPSGPRFGIWPWVGLGAGAVSLSASLGFELARRSAEKAAKADDTQIGYKQQLDREQSRQTVARVFLVAGGVLAVGSGALLAVDWSARRQRQSATQLGVACLPGACGFDVRGSF